MCFLKMKGYDPAVLHLYLKQLSASQYQILFPGYAAPSFEAQFAWPLFDLFSFEIVTKSAAFKKVKKLNRLSNTKIVIIVNMEFTT